MAITGADIAINYRTSEQAARETAESVRQAGVRVHAVQADVSSAEQVAAMIEEVSGALGPVDLLVNNAGVFHYLSHDETTLEAWRQTLDVNLTGSYLVAWAVKQSMIERGFGRIVNVASTEGLTAARRTGPYTVSKHGVVGFTRSLAVDLGRRGVTANAVCPGATLTGMTERIPEADRQRFARRHVPVGRYADPKEIAYVIVALCAPEASYVNGAVIPVDGGLTAGSG